MKQAASLLNLFLVCSVVFMAGFLYGEYKACPKDKYSFDSGCEVKK